MREREKENQYLGRGKKGTKEQERKQKPYVKIQLVLGGTSRPSRQGP